MFMKNSPNADKKNMQVEYNTMTLEETLLKKKQKKTTEKVQYFYSFRKIQINIAT